MGWSLGYDPHWSRDVGYGVPATCDAPDCGASIDRGLAHVCGGEPYGGDAGCGLYFCEEDLPGPDQTCPRCALDMAPYEPTPDVAQWVQWKLTHESWARWRAEHPEFVAAAATGGA